MRFYFFCLVAFLMGCNKEQASKSFNPYYKAEVNGNTRTVYACGSSGYIAQYLGDTVIFAGFGCDGERAMFLIRNIQDGTYTLGAADLAYYGLGAANYKTDEDHTGTITIKSGRFQNEVGNYIPFIEGTFSFDAIDTLTDATVHVTKGKYLLQKLQQ